MAALLLLLCSLGTSGALAPQIRDVSWGDREKTTSELESKTESFNSAVSDLVTKVENHVPKAPDPPASIPSTPISAASDVAIPKIDIAIPKIVVPEPETLSTKKPESVDIDQLLEPVIRKSLPPLPVTGGTSETVSSTKDLDSIVIPSLVT